MMIGLQSVNALTSAQTQLQITARKIAQEPATPDDMVSLLQARAQFGGGVQLVHTEDQMTRKLLDILG